MYSVYSDELYKLLKFSAQVKKTKHIYQRSKKFSSSKKSNLRDYERGIKGNMGLWSTLLTRTTPVTCLAEDELDFDSVQVNISRYVFANEFAIGTVLDVACGSGYGSNYLALDKTRTVIGLDLLDENILHAKSRYSGAGRYFLRGDAMNLPFPNNFFDTIVSLETIEHLPRYLQFLSECNRVLKNSGSFVISTPTSLFSYGQEKPLHVHHVKEFSCEQFQSLMERYFDKIRFYGIYYWNENDYERHDKITSLPSTLVYSLYVAKNLVGFFSSRLLKVKSSERAYKISEIEDKNIDFQTFLVCRYKLQPLKSGRDPQYIMAVGKKRT